MTRAATGLRWLWLAPIAVALDQASKHALLAQVEPFRPLAVLPVLNIVLTFNTGVSFSMLKLPGEAQRWPLAMLAAVIVALLARWMSRLPAGRVALSCGIALVIGGAVGNLIDRLFLGQVVDFIQFHYGGWSFAVFNLADAAISAGVALMLLDSLAGAGRKRRETT